jgi:hypothetical protein
VPASKNWFDESADLYSVAIWTTESFTLLNTSFNTELLPLPNNPKLFCVKFWPYTYKEFTEAPVISSKIKKKVKFCLLLKKIGIM